MLKVHNAVTPVRLEPRPFGLESSTLPLSHCAPLSDRKNENVLSVFGDALRPSQHFYQPIWTFLELNQHNYADDTMSCSRTQHSALCAVLFEGLKPATPGLELKSNTTINRPLRSSVVQVDLTLSLLRLISMIGMFQLRSREAMYSL